MSRTIIIVGGVAGGATAAARARRLDENARIILLERGEYISFANCGLPYYIGGIIHYREDLLVTTIVEFKQRYNIDIRNFSEAVSIDRNNRNVSIRNRQSGVTYNESYDKLILSPGAEPLKPELPGINLSNIFTLRNLPDTDRIKNLVDTHQPSSAVVVGGGFIGLEMVENLAHRGVKTTVVEMSSQVMAPLDIEMAAIVHDFLQEKGVVLKLNTRVEAFSEGENGLCVQVSSGKTVNCDMVVLAMGITPESKLAVDAGLALNERGGIKVNRFLQSSDENIYVTGDVIEISDFIFQNPVMVPLAGPANKQGRIVADNAAGRESEYSGVLGTSILKLFDLTVASTGMNEKTLKQQNIPYLKSYTHSFSHATYYPGSDRMSFKLLFSPNDGKVLGAQIIGKDGVDKRIDIVATTLHAGLTVYDLEKLELAYAPPYGSAKDPINIAGYVASNILMGDMAVMHWDEFGAADENLVVIDLRTADEIEADGAVPDAVNIPIDELRGRMHRLDRNNTYLLFCAIGLRGYIGYRILSQTGFKTLVFSGGYEILKHTRQLKKEGHPPFLD